MHSISDLMAFCRKTTGDVPAKLVGASTTVAGSKMYLFGGRLASERRMVSDLYVFDMESYVWERIPARPDDDVPGARYFHSAEHWNNHLVVFGGMGSNPNSTSPSEDLCVLNDVRFFDLASRRWLPASTGSTVSEKEKASPPTSPSSPSSSNNVEDLTPKARYAHLSAITSDRMFIIGGQDVSNIWMDEVYVYDLVQRRWAQRREYPRHCGSYRSVAVASEWRVRLPEQEQQQQQQRTRAAMVMGSTTATENKFTNVGAAGAMATTPPESLVHMPYSAKPTEEFPNDILLYSNHNFTDVKREFDAITPLPTGDFIVNDRSQDITGTNFPPGLRFPSGAVLGTHLIVAGTYLAQTYQSFSIWALNLLTLTWTRIEAGSAISPNGGSSSGGSWFRAVVHARANQLLVFGDRRGNLVDDYNKRLLCWDDVVVVDLEASGIYQPPPRALAPHAQQLGLSALEQGVLTDFEIVCDDGRAVACSRKVLEERWPWFREQRRRFTERALGAAAETLPASATTGASASVVNNTAVPLPDVAGPAHEQPRPDPRLTPRSLALSEPYPITLALAQYFYTLALTTPLQHAPAVLSQLLILANTYGLAHLEALVKHAMHRALSDANSVGVYEVATLCSCRSLQIRALNTVMAYSQGRRGANANRSGRGDRDQQQQQHRDHRNGGGGGSSSGGSGGGGVYINGASTPGGGGGSSTTSDGGAAAVNGTSGGGSARPRGMSDAPFRSAGGGGGGVLAISAVAMRHGGNMSNGT